MPPRLSKKYLILISILLFVFFIFFSYLVAKERFTQFDFDTTVKFQDKISRKLDYPFSLLSGLGSAEITGAIWLMIVTFLIIKRYFFAAFAQLLLPIALFIELFGKLFVLHPAPPYLFYRGVLKFNFPSHFVHTDYSYPSGHMTRTAFIIAFLMTYIYIRNKSSISQLFFQPLLFGFLVLMAISRIYLGEHWTSDVVGGTLIGLSFGLFTGSLVPYKNKQILSESKF